LNNPQADPALDVLLDSAHLEISLLVGRRVIDTSAIVLAGGRAHIGQASQIRALALDMVASDATGHNRR